VCRPGESRDPEKSILRIVPAKAGIQKNLKDKKDNRKKNFN
jgi:hypothetical protein